MDHRSGSVTPWSRPGPESPPDPQVVLRSSTLKAVDHRNPTNGAPGWWGVRCPRCRAWLTRYDFSAGDALSIARGVLASGRHQCGGEVMADIDWATEPGVDPVFRAAILWWHQATGGSGFDDIYTIEEFLAHIRPLIEADLQRKAAGLT